MGRIAAVAAACLLAAACRKAQSQEPAIASASPALQAELQKGDAAVVTASHGEVELLHDGNVSVARVGDRIGVKDAVRTTGGEVDLAVDGVKVRLHESSRLEVKQTKKRSMLALVRGSIESEVEKNAQLDVEVEDSDATAHSEGGHFFLTSDGKGVVAVASVTGSVHLSSGGKSVDVDKGQVSKVMGNRQAPSPPADALRRVLLAVQWPEQNSTNKPSVPIVGKVEPGSRVFVQGQPVTVDNGGTFRAEVPLKQGKQKIAVVTVDALGRRKQLESVVRRDDSLPDVKVKKKLWQWR
ncbi:MAG TPA: FecR domain-containing protein [Myxococcales bacterium]|nr:FecR domain-containing protein [Myxococcales bacterium]